MASTTLSNSTSLPSLRRRIGVKLFKWMLLTMLIGALPILIKLLFLVAEDQVHMKALLGDGESFLIAAGVSAGGIGELYFRWRQAGAANQSSQKSNSPEGAAVICSLVVLAMGAALYGKYAIEMQPGQELTMRGIWVSIAIFTLSAITSAACFVISELE